MISRESEEPTNEVDQELTEIEDMATLKQALAEEKQKAESYLSNWQRAQADFVNYKRRTEQEKVETGQFAKATLALNILPALDDLERAFASIPPRLASHDWVNGIRLIGRKLRTSLEAQGLSPIVAVGEPFDPHLHEAVRQDKGEEGMVIEEVEKGYKLQDRIIRPSKVVVGNGELEEEEESE